MKFLKTTITGFAIGHLLGRIMTEITWTAFIILPAMFAYLWLTTEAMQMPQNFFLEEDIKKYQAKWDKKPVFYKKIIIKFDDFLRA